MVLISPGEAERRLEREHLPRPSEITIQKTGATQRKLDESFWMSYFQSRISDLEERIEELDRRNVGFIKINLLASKKLSAPLDIIVEPDEDGFIARSADIPLYGYGDDALEALDALKCEIESLYDDLMEDDKFTDEWLRIKELLHERIIA